MGEGIAGMWFEERGERLTVTVISLHAEDGEHLTASVWVISRDGWGDRWNVVWGKGRVFDGEGNFIARRGRWPIDGERLNDFGVWTLRVFERLRESAWEIESAWETERDSMSSRSLKSPRGKHFPHQRTGKPGKTSFKSSSFNWISSFKNSRCY